ncbi:MAG: glycosyltransferase family 1 protein [Alphaproteobacteria bacterium]|nr:glycosyltransferase family 1 protein [Alphaproteobacteria bacterium]
MPQQSLDIVMVADSRFAGGTLAALETDVRGFSALGARVGLMPVRSAFLNDERDFTDPRFNDLFDLPGVARLAPGSSARAGTIFFHHPLTFFFGIEEGGDLHADVSALVAHHPPFRGDGSLEYDPLATLRRIHKSFGVSPLVAPISEAVRRQLRSFAPFVRLTRNDWPNHFAIEGFHPKRKIFSQDEIVIGRHGRVDPLKWSDSAPEIEAGLPAASGHRIRVMGCPLDHLDRLGVDHSKWEILEFNAEPVPEFLERLDVFSYFHSSRWMECFGRTVAEAALMKAVCILDPKLEQNFGPVGIYCQPAEVADVVARLSEDRTATRLRVDAARDIVAEQYSVKSLKAHWHQIMADRGDTSREGGVSCPPLTTIRKMAGLYRRQYAWR